MKELKVQQNLDQPFNREIIGKRGLSRGDVGICHFYFFFNKCFTNDFLWVE